MKMIHKAQLYGKKRGQVLLLFVFAMVFLILFLGLGIDLGFAYMTRSSLSKAVDAATLAGALHLGEGTAAATSMATNMFFENYQSSGRDVTNPVLNVTFTTDLSGTAYVNVSARTQIRTFFMRILPNWKTLTVGSSAQATRARAIICLVLDRSGSMGDSPGPGQQTGAQAMPAAVTNFLNYFSDNRDEVAMVTFDTTPSVDVQMPTSFPPQPFKTAIRSKVISRFSPLGNVTFAQGGLTNGLVQIGRAPVNIGENVLKAVVFFTDGKANTFQDTLNCSSPEKVNISNGDTTTTITFYDPSNGGSFCSRANNSTIGNCGSLHNICNGVSQFFSQSSQAWVPFTAANVGADAEYRAVQVANDMRANHIFVYSIGLGANIRQSFLRQIANYPPFTGYVPTPYDGKMLIAPDPSHMGAVFETVAREIALRLTR
jgi:Flp pilus assembly protein TadG